MNYLRIHEAIIAKATGENRVRNKHTYYELHHIIPRCLGGSSKKTNLVLLTFKEHFLVHWLLCKIYKSDINAMYKLSTAFVRMCSVNEFQQRKISSRKYIIAKTIERKAKRGVAVGGALIIKRSSTWKDNISAALRGGTRSIKGKTYEEIYSPDVIERVKASRRVTKNKGYVWINDGILMRCVPPSSEIPIGWSKGRIKLGIAKCWYNNGNIEKLLSDDNKINKYKQWIKGRLNAKNKKDT